MKNTRLCLYIPLFKKSYVFCSFAENLQEDIQVKVSANDIIVKVEVDEDAWWATQGLVDPEKIALSDIKIDLNQDFGNQDYFESLKVSFITLFKAVFLNLLYFEDPFA